MSDRSPNVVDGLRKPEYVGENRCLPCTVVNVAIAVVGSALLAARSRHRRGRLLAGAVLGGSLAAIYLRGYLVPGTPALTKRYLPDPVLAAFDKEPAREGTRYGGWETVEEGDDAFESVSEGGVAERDEAGDGVEETESETGNGRTDDGADDDDSEDPEFETVEKIEYRRENEVDPEAFLLEVDAVEPTADGTDLRLTEDVADRIEERLKRHREEPREPDALADLFGVDREKVRVKDREYPAISIGRRIRKWPSEAALVADLATADAIEEQTDRWRVVPVEQRVEILEALRAFHEGCPVCGGPIVMSSDTVESCCRSYEVVMLGCGECGAPLLEFDPEAVGAGAADTGIQP